jgi:hypothetical protein
MITREIMSRGEGNIVKEDPDIELRKTTSQCKNMTSEQGISHDEIEF